MDEPSEGLAPTIVEGLIDTFKRLVSERAAVLLDRAEPRCRDLGRERQLAMVGGQIATETTAAPLERPRGAAAVPRRRAVGPLEG